MAAICCEGWFGRVMLMGIKIAANARLVSVCSYVICSILGFNKRFDWR